MMDHDSGDDESELYDYEGVMNQEEKCEDMVDKMSRKLIPEVR